MSGKTTKKTPKPDEMRAEYRFDYSKSKPNRFADDFRKGAVAVVLDPDVAAVFSSSESVNTLLRSVIEALPSQPQKKTASK